MTVSHIKLARCVRRARYSSLRRAGKPNVSQFPFDIITLMMAQGDAIV
jgi:hypothetical protein